MNCPALMLLGLLACAPAVLADEAGSVTAAASATETLRPTRGAFDVTILSTSRQAPAARTDNATTTAAVRTALLAAGLPAADIKSSQLTVGPHWGSPQPAGFDANNRLHVDTRNLDAIGVYLDAALNAGAHEVSPVSFAADDRDEARHRALARAVAEAEGDARAMAAAAHRSLGALVALSTQGLPSDGELTEAVVMTPRFGRAVGAAPPPTAVIVPDISVTATVTGRWRVATGTP